MVAEPVYRRIVNDEALVRGLGDAEARMLVEWLIDWSELLEESMPDEEAARRHVASLHRKARGIGKFVVLWGNHRSKSSAMQLAAAERFQFPIPEEHLETDEAMAMILEWESENLAQVC